MLCMSHTELVTQLQLGSPPSSVQKAMLEMGCCVQLIVTEMATLTLICLTFTIVSQTPRTSSASRFDMKPYPRSHDCNQLQDTCPHLYNPHQSRDKLNDGHPHGGSIVASTIVVNLIFYAVAFVIDGNELPSDVIIANASVLASKTVKCLGALGNTDLSVQVYTVVQSELVTQDPAAVRKTLTLMMILFQSFGLQDICETEANIHQPLDSELTEGAMQCQSATTGATAWIYFTTGNIGFLCLMCNSFFWVQRPASAPDLMKIFYQTIS